jgi:hypothetical protein
MHTETARPRSLSPCESPASPPLVLCLWLAFFDLLLLFERLMPLFQKYADLGGDGYGFGGFCREAGGLAVRRRLPACPTRKLMAHRSFEPQTKVCATGYQ